MTAKRVADRFRIEALSEVHSDNTSTDQQTTILICTHQGHNYRVSELEKVIKK